MAFDKVNYKISIDERTKESQEVLGPGHRTAIYKCIRKVDGVKCKINKEDNSGAENYFGGKNYPKSEYLLDPDQSEDFVVRGEKSTIIETDSLYDRLDLAEFSQLKLETLPEYTRTVVEERVQVRSKQDLIDLILSKRKGAAPWPPVEPKKIRKPRRPKVAAKVEEPEVEDEGEAEVEDDATDQVEVISKGA